MGRLGIRWAAPLTRRGHRGPRRGPRSLPYRPTAPAPPRARPGPLLTHYDAPPLHCRIPGLGRAAARAAAPLAAAPDNLQAAKNRSAGNASSALRRNQGVRGLPRQTARFQRGSRSLSHRRASAAVRKRATGRLRFPARRQRACGPCAGKPGGVGVAPTKRHRTWRQEMMSGEAANYFLSSGDASLAVFPEMQGICGARPGICGAAVAKPRA